jgi:hypothetical protein
MFKKSAVTVAIFFILSAVFAMFSENNKWPSGILSASSSQLIWSSAQLGTYPWGALGSVDSVSCFASNSCFATDANGNIYVSNDPQYGPNAWSRFDVDLSNQINQIYCESSSFCIAIDNNGNVLESNNPASGASAWIVSNIDASNPLFSISCYQMSLCLATDQKGNIAVSTNPAGVSPSWQVLNIDGTTPIDSVYCASAYCVVGDSTGHILYSATPTNSSGWYSLNIDSGHSIDSIVCPSFCIAVDSAGNVLTTSNPSASNWAIFQIALAYLTSVNCISPNLCAITDSSGDIFESSLPLQGLSAWNGQNIAPGQSLLSVSCTTLSCLAGSDQGNIYLSASGQSSGWSKYVLAGFTRINSGTCSQANFCLAASDSGNVFLSTNPTAGASSWTTQTIDATNSINSIYCVSTSFCLAADSAGNVFLSTNPTAGASSWTTQTIDATNSINSIYCVSTSFCLAADSAGNVFLSTNPTAGASSWTTQMIDATNSINSIYCVSTSFCLAADSAGNVFLSTNPTAGASSWTTQTIDATNSINSIYCVSTSFCLAADSAGNVFLSTNPTAGASSWTTQMIDATNSINSIYCVSTSFCLAADSAGNVFLSTNPTAGASSWSPTHIEGTAAITFIDCVNSGYCLGGDALGDIITGLSPFISAANPYNPISPTRICDTRLTSPINQCQGKTLAPTNISDDIMVAGQGGLPANGISAVVLNVTVTNTTADSYLTLYPGSSPAPLASDLNWTAGETIANLVTVSLGPSGDVTASIAPNLGSADLIIDLEGYYGPNSAGSGLFNPVSPYRICDTRLNNQTQCEGKILGPGSILNVQVTGTGGLSGVPSNGVAAVVLNLTAIGPTSETGGFLTAFPANSGNKIPLASNVNFSIDQTIPNRIIIPVGTNGMISVYNFSGFTDIAIDVNGWFSDGSVADPQGLLFTATSPYRICDTRTGTGSPPNQCSGKSLTAANVLNVNISNQAYIPSTAAVLVGNATITNTTAISYLTIYPSNLSSPPVISDLNWQPNTTIANMIEVSLSPSGSISVTSPFGSADLIIDVSGWYS